MRIPDKRKGLIQEMNRDLSPKLIEELTFTGVLNSQKNNPSIRKEHNTPLQELGIPVLL